MLRTTSGRVLFRAFGIELPFVLLGPASLLLLLGRQAIFANPALIVLSIGVHVVKNAVLAPTLRAFLKPLDEVARARAGGGSLSELLLDAAARRAQRVPRRFGLLWAITWGLSFPATALLAQLLLPGALLSGARAALTVAVLGLAAFCAAFPLLAAVLTDALVSSAVDISFARMERGLPPADPGPSFKRTLLVFAACLSVAPTAWMASVALLANAPSVLVGFFALVAVLWAPLCALFLARAWAAPVQAINAAVDTIVREGQVLVAARVPIFPDYEMSRLTRAVNEMILRLAQSGQQRAQDLVELQRLFQEAQAALQVRDDFLTQAAHELRTPLTALLLQLKGMERKVQDGGVPVADTLKRAAQKVMQLSMLVSDLLDVGRIQSGKMELHPAPFGLAAVINEVSSGFQAVSPRHTLRVDLPDTEVMVDGDRGRIEQVVSNLVENAIKYSPEGGEVRISLETPEGDAVLAVCDQGIGIDSASHPRLFQRFFRAETSKESQIAGLGLGLFICREIVERHGGTIRFESKPGKGSTFYVTLKRSAGKAAAL